MLMSLFRHTSLVCLFGCAAACIPDYDRIIMQALKRLQVCEQVCRIVDSGVFDDRFFIIMEVSTRTNLKRSEHDADAHSAQNRVV
jgi:hypothetical protein